MRIAKWRFFDDDGLLTFYHDGIEVYAEKVVDALNECESQLAEAKAMIKSADEKLEAAADRVNIHFGCDTAEVLADVILDYREKFANIQARLAGYEWIPVGERLPEDRATILAAFKNREILTATYNEHYEGFGGVENYWHIEGWHSGEVTHWMPLPEAPKEDE